MLQDREKYMEKLNKWKLEDLHKFMDLLDMPRGSGDKVYLLMYPARLSFCSIHSKCMTWHRVVKENPNVYEHKTGL